MASNCRPVETSPYGKARRSLIPHFKKVSGDLNVGCQRGRDAQSGMQTSVRRDEAQQRLAAAKQARREADPPLLDSRTPARPGLRPGPLMEFVGRPFRGLGFQSFLTGRSNDSE